MSDTLTSYSVLCLPCSPLCLSMKLTSAIERTMNIQQNEAENICELIPVEITFGTGPSVSVMFRNNRKRSTNQMFTRRSY